MVANKGKWNGQQLVSAQWIENMTNTHTSIYERQEEYGYLWWRYRHNGQQGPIEIIYAHGNGGNFTFIVESLDLVVTFTGKAYGTPEQFVPFRFLLKRIIPQFEELYSSNEQ